MADLTFEQLAATALARIPDTKKRYEDVSADLGLPLVGSLEWQDRRAGWGGDWPGSFASVTLDVAVDHLHTWWLLCTRPNATLPVYAHMTLIRSVIECAVQVQWFIDTAQSPEVRIARALWERLRNLECSVTVENEIRRKDPEKVALLADATTPDATERLRQLRAEADARGLSPVKMLATVSLLERYPRREGSDDVLWWRYTSGIAHGRMWATLQNEREVVRAGATMTRYKESAIPGVAAGLTVVAVDRVERAIDELGRYREPPN